MSGSTGLRERKKERTRQAISDAAIRLFLEHGYDHVSVAQVADAAEVAKRTLFGYFPSKEDLVLHRFADQETESARVLRQRPDDACPLGALRAHFLHGLRGRDASTGLTDAPEVLRLYQLIHGTPSLAARMLRYTTNGEQALTAALCETTEIERFTAALAASQIGAVLRTLATQNVRRLIDGETVRRRYPAARAEAEHAFTLLRDGLGGVC